MRSRAACTRCGPPWKPTRFHASTGAILDGVGVRWTDPLGASNQTWSYWTPQLQIYHEAHVEAVESGTHYIQIDNQPGCTVGAVSVDGSGTGSGPQTVAIQVGGTPKTFTIFVDVNANRDQPAPGRLLTDRARRARP